MSNSQDNLNNVLLQSPQILQLKNKVKSSIIKRKQTKLSKYKEIRENKSKLSNDITPKTEDLQPQQEIDTRLERSDLMDEIRQNIQDVKNQYNRVNLKQNDDSFNLDGDNDKNKSPFENDEEINTQNTTETTPDTQINTSNNELDDDDVASKIVSGVSKAEDIGEGLETGAEAVEVAGGGPEDPISDVLAGIMAVGGAIATGLDIDTDKTSPPQVPTIQVNQGLESANV
jgi:hypothetical protein